MARRSVAELLDMAREVGSSASSAGSRAASHAASRVAEEVQSRGRDASSELASLWSRIEELFNRNVTPTARDMADRAEPYWREGRDYAVDAAGRLRDAARARPLLAVGIAVAATWLVTTMLQGRRSR